jgi:hypothetical protein
MLNPRTRKISQLDPNASATPDLSGALLEMSLQLGLGIYASRKITYEQFVATLPIGGYVALTLAQAQLLVVAQPAAVRAGTLYGITGKWNAAAADSTVYVHGVRPDAYHALGVMYAQGAAQLVQVQVMAGTYKKFSSGEELLAKDNRWTGTNLYEQGIQLSALGGAPDLALMRSSAGVLEINTGVAGSPATVSAMDYVAQAAPAAYNSFTKLVTKLIAAEAGVLTAAQKAALPAGIGANNKLVADNDPRLIDVRGFVDYQNEYFINQDELDTRNYNPFTASNPLKSGKAFAISRNDTVVAPCLVKLPPIPIIGGNVYVLSFRLAPNTTTKITKLTIQNEYGSEVITILPGQTVILRSQFNFWIPVLLSDLDSSGRNRGDFKPDTYYNAKDLIIKDKILYAANITHVSGATFDATKWTAISTGGAGYDDTALKATIYGRFGIAGFLANTAYKAGDEIIRPDGLARVAAKADFTTTSTYVAANWQVTDAVLTPEQAQSATALYAPFMTWNSALGRMVGYPTANQAQAVGHAVLVNAQAATVATSFTVAAIASFCDSYLTVQSGRTLSFTGDSRLRNVNLSAQDNTKNPLQVYATATSNDPAQGAVFESGESDAPLLLQADTTGGNQVAVVVLRDYHFDYVAGTSGFVHLYGNSSVSGHDAGVTIVDHAAGGGGSTLLTGAYTAPAASAQTIAVSGATAFFDVGIRTAGGKSIPLDPGTGYTVSAGQLSILAAAGVQAGDVITYSYATGAVQAGSPAYTAGAGLQLSGNTFTVDPAGITTRKVTTPATDLVLEQTGDQFGLSRLSLVSRNGSAGAVFTTALPLVDFAFAVSQNGTPYQLNLRYEARASDTIGTKNLTGEFQLIDPYQPNPGDPQYPTTTGFYTVLGKDQALFLNGQRVGIGLNDPQHALHLAGKIGINNTASGEPPTNANGGVLYVQNGALMYKGSNGSITTLAPA